MPKETTTSPKDPQLTHLPMMWKGQQYYSELARTSSFLLVGTIALMTFLLSVGLQHPKVDLSIFLYSTLVILGLNLVAYVLGHLMHERVMMKAMAIESTKDKNELEVLTTAKKQAHKQLKVMRVVQQVLFILGVIAVVGFAIIASQLFFAAATAQPTTATQ